MLAKEFHGDCAMSLAVNSNMIDVVRYLTEHNGKIQFFFIQVGRNDEVIH